MNDGNVLIIGAGLGGLAAAAALQRAGLRVRVFERAPVMGEIGAGIMLTPNAVRALESIGALEAVSAMAVEPEKSYSRNYLTGEIMGERSVADVYRAKFGKPMLTIHRADLHRALSSTVLAHDAAAIVLDHEFTGLSSSASGVEAAFANGNSVRGDALIGADGIRSAVRSAVGLNLAPRFTGLVAWRGLIPAARLPEHLRSTSTTSWIGEQRHIIDYTVGNLKNYVAIAHEPDWQSESWSTPAQLSDVLGVYSGWHQDVLTMLAATPADGLFKWALHDRDPIDRWVFGHAALLGDAAHPMLPLMAQGAAMAIEDAAILGRAFKTAANVDEALSRYERSRVERARWTQLESRTAVEVYHSVRKGKWLSETEKRGNYLYSYDVATATL
jgi:salicylate hydroxylase